MTQHANTARKDRSTPFRNWITNIWYEHCDEVFEWTGQNPRYLSAEYFEKYKWWLKAEYKRRMKE